MASLIPGYEYDIFISYRQKDNKGDRWVSNFVEALKTELEATFKEDVFVYFDENPHDRLQETHNVDKSLEGKLKCLIFMPILSQTYCDPNSYAWQYEFLAFLRMSEKDRFGKDVKLRSGNVASRILPIRIHDLEQEDVKLFEKETGSVVRAMDFVFKTSSGVNRPLKANEDHPQDNLNKTFYSDQINKVANSIKEIISGLKTEPVEAGKEKTLHIELLEEVKKEERKEVQEKPTKTSKRKLLSGVAILAILIIAAVFTYPKIFKRDTLEKLRSSGERISVAVMPFQNMTNDTTWNVWQDGIQFNLITFLSNYSDELKVSQTESINGLLQSKGLTDYASITPSVASRISQKLEANIFIRGNINKEGTIIRVNAQLIESKTKEIFKSFQIEGNSEKIMPIIDSLSAMIKDFLIISKLKKELSADLQPFASQSTNSPEAYRNFILGNNAYYKYDMPTAVKLLLQAIKIDSNFNLAALRLSTAYSNMGWPEEGKKWCLKVYKKREQMPTQLKLWTNRTYSLFFETPYEEIKCLRQLQENDDQMPMIYYAIGRAYCEGLYQYDKAIPELEKALKIYKKWDSNPPWAPNYTVLGYAYHKTGQFKKEKKLYKKAEKVFPDDLNLEYRQVILSLDEGDSIKANQYIERIRILCKEDSYPDIMIKSILADIFSEGGNLVKAEEYYRQMFLTDPANPAWSNSLAYFLIDKNQNINEGLELIDKVLKLSPENYGYLDTKGWGLYKQGKYQEALDILQKSWDLRREKAEYNHAAFLHLEAAKKAVANQKNN